MEIFSALLAICVGNSPVPGELPTQRPVTWSFDVYFDLRPNKRLSKQSLGWWFETLSPPLWRHRNALMIGQGWVITSHYFARMLSRIQHKTITNINANYWSLNTQLRWNLNQNTHVPTIVICQQRKRWIFLFVCLFVFLPGLQRSLKRILMLSLFS